MDSLDRADCSRMSGRAALKRQKWRNHSSIFSSSVHGNSGGFRTKLAWLGASFLIVAGLSSLTFVGLTWNADDGEASMVEAAYYGGSPLRRRLGVASEDIDVSSRATGVLLRHSDAVVAEAEPLRVAQQPSVEENKHVEEKNYSTTETNLAFITNLVSVLQQVIGQVLSVSITLGASSGGGGGSGGGGDGGAGGGAGGLGGLTGGLGGITDLAGGATGGGLPGASALQDGGGIGGVAGAAGGVTGAAGGVVGMVGQLTSLLTTLLGLLSHFGILESVGQSVPLDVDGRLVTIETLAEQLSRLNASVNASSNFKKPTDISSETAILSKGSHLIGEDIELKALTTTIASLPQPAVEEDSMEATSSTTAIPSQSTPDYDELVVEVSSTSTEGLAVSRAQDSPPESLLLLLQQLTTISRLLPLFRD